MSNPLAISGKEDCLIVNCIRQDMNTEVAIRLYTHYKMIRSTMIWSKEYNLNKKSNHTHGLEQQKCLIDNSMVHFDQKFVNIRSVLP
jgi:hypothetical protein